MAVLKLNEETKQLMLEPKTHLTTIQVLSNKPLPAKQIDEAFELLNVRQVP